MSTMFGAGQRRTKLFLAAHDDDDDDVRLYGVRQGLGLQGKLMSKLTRTMTTMTMS